ncbi:hypothetical protein PAHAL_1G364300 [Panicum hallii]|uniref:Uncharacterized protein n=1 Tax=Panicum hallii TaxID=206008 RepID=A0A2T8KXD1_9POAL|nr:hypothetical protein PAHAL_1G364300 [Panicum hallii]
MRELPRLQRGSLLWLSSSPARWCHAGSHLPRPCPRDSAAAPRARTRKASVALRDVWHGCAAARPPRNLRNVATTPASPVVSLTRCTGCRRPSELVDEEREPIRFDGVAVARRERSIIHGEECAEGLHRKLLTPFRGFYVKNGSRLLIAIQFRGFRVKY